MAGKNEEWSVNSGKSAYGAGVSRTPERNPRSGPGAVGFAVAVLLLIAIGLGVAAWRGFFNPPLQWLRSTLTAPADTQPAPSNGNSAAADSELARLLQENSTLRKELNDKEKVISQQKLVIEANSAIGAPPEYSIIKTISVQYKGYPIDIMTEHKFSNGQEHWVSALCYTSPAIGGVRYRIDLIKRDQTDFRPQPRLVDPETLVQSGIPWPDVFRLGSNCPWMDGARYTEEELSSLALTGVQDSVQPELAPLPPPLPPVEVATPTPIRGSRKVFEAKDMVGRDIGDLSVASQAECEAACTNSSSCVGYTYDAWNRRCFPKSGIGSLRTEPRSVTVVFSDYDPPFSAVPEEMIMRRGKAFPNTPYEIEQVSSYEVCADHCLQGSRCLGVNFIYATGLCEFFASPREFTSRPAVTLGYKWQKALP